MNYDRLIESCMWIAGAGLLCIGIVFGFIGLLNWWDGRKRKTKPAETIVLYRPKSKTDAAGMQ